MSILEIIRFKLCEELCHDTPEILMSYNALFEAIKLHVGDSYDENYFYDKIHGLLSVEKETAFEQGMKAGAKLTLELLGGDIAYRIVNN